MQLNRGSNARMADGAWDQALVVYREINVLDVNMVAATILPSLHICAGKLALPSPASRLAQRRLKLARTLLSGWLWLLRLSAGASMLRRRACSDIIYLTSYIATKSSLYTL